VDMDADEDDEPTPVEPAESDTSTAVASAPTPSSAMTPADPRLHAHHCRRGSRLRRSNVVRWLTAVGFHPRHRRLGPGYSNTLVYSLPTHTSLVAVKHSCFYLFDFINLLFRM
jgi:hypothetical protein